MVIGISWTRTMLVGNAGSTWVMINSWNSSKKYFAKLFFMLKQICFGDIVVVGWDQIGVIVKSWNNFQGWIHTRTHDVYVRNKNCVENYRDDQIDRYMVRHKELDQDDLYYNLEALS